MKLLKSIFVSLISTGSTEECIPAGLPEKYREHYRIIENTGTCYIKRAVFLSKYEHVWSRKHLLAGLKHLTASIPHD